jgi:dTDP-4-dehydrorhamnose reductase
VKILLTGSNGYIGSSIKNLFLKYSFFEIDTPTRTDLDLENTNNVDLFLKNKKLIA